MKTKILKMLLGTGIVVGGITVMSMTIAFGGWNHRIGWGSHLSHLSHLRISSPIILNKGISKDLQNELPTASNVANKIKNVKNAIVNITKNVTGISDIVSSNVDISIIGNNLTGLNLNYNPNKVIKLKDLKTELKDGFTTYKKLYCYLDSSSKYCKNLTDIVNNQIDKLSNLNDYFKAVVLFKYYSLSFVKELTQKPVNGVCGTTKNACVTGTLVDISDTNTEYKWQCKGKYGGTTANCSLSKFINACTLANVGKKNSRGQTCKCTTETKKITDWINCIQAKRDGVEWSAPIGRVMCVGGRIKVNKGSGWYNYQYEGLKTISSSTHCNFEGLNVDGVCNNSVKNGCSAGSAYGGRQVGSYYRWNCSGSNGGNAANCFKYNPQVSWYHVCNVTDYNFSNVYGTYIRTRSNLRDWHRRTYCNGLSNNFEERKVVANGKQREIWVYSTYNPGWKGNIVRNNIASISLFGGAYNGHEQISEFNNIKNKMKRVGIYLRGNVKSSYRNSIAHLKATNGGYFKLGSRYLGNTITIVHKQDWVGIATNRCGSFKKGRFGGERLNDSDCKYSSTWGRYRKTLQIIESN